jgi:hypothetical protein
MMKAQFVYENLQFLNEDYNSLIEIKKLAEEINDSLSDLIKDDLSPGNANDIHNKYLNEFINSNTPILLSDLVNIRNYDVLRPFIKSGIGIFPSTGGNITESGGYFTEKEIKSLKYLFGIEKDLIRENWYAGYMTPDNLKKSEGKIRKEKYPGGIILLKKWYARTKPLIHELQHAYDWVRSKGKGFPKKADYNDDDIKRAEETGDYAKYFRDQRELSAFFSEYTEDRGIFFSRSDKGEARDIHQSWKLFKKEFYPWEFLTPKQKKIIVSKFSGIYHKITEKAREAERERQKKTYRNQYKDVKNKNI